MPGVGRIAPKQKVGSARYPNDIFEQLRECGNRSYGTSSVSDTLYQLGHDIINVHAILDADEIQLIMVKTKSKSLLEGLAKAGKEYLKSSGGK